MPAVVPLVSLIGLGGAEGSPTNQRYLSLDLDGLRSEATAAIEFRVSARSDVRVLYYRSAGNAATAELELFGDRRLGYRELDARSDDTVINEWEAYLSVRDVETAVEYCALAGLLENDGLGFRKKYEDTLQRIHVSDGATVYLTLALEEYSGLVREETDPFTHTVVFHAPSAGRQYPELRALIVIGNALAEVFRDEAGD